MTALRQVPNHLIGTHTNQVGSVRNYKKNPHNQSLTHSHAALCEHTKHSQEASKEHYDTVTVTADPSGNTAPQELRSARLSCSQPLSLQVYLDMVDEEGAMCQILFDYITRVIYNTLQHFNSDFLAASVRFL